MREYPEKFHERNTENYWMEQLINKLHVYARDKGHVI